MFREPIAHALRFERSGGRKKESGKHRPQRFTLGPTALPVTTPLTFPVPAGDNSITRARDVGVTNLRLFPVDTTGNLTRENLTLAVAWLAVGTAVAVGEMIPLTTARLAWEAAFYNHEQAKCLPQDHHGNESRQRQANS